MAEINSSAGQNRHKGGVRRSKKLSTKVDLTPMVDLGFLLITFFIFTTSMSKPKRMDLLLPAGEKTINNLGESTALTIIPISGNRVFYYHGSLERAMQNSQYGTTYFAGKNSIGDIIRSKQAALAKNPALKKEDLMLIIKPALDASYQNVVDALDEVLINALDHYAFIDLDPAEKAFLQQLGIK